ncbi:MAG: molybdopterin-dependent oxidoreductase, partial [Anaerolineae bacterium]
MRVDRRQFMQIAGAAMVTFAGLGKVIREQLFNWGRAPLPKPEGGEEKFVPSVCLQCPAGCGILVRVVGGRAVKIEGNPMHPLNEGLLCPKGQAALYLLYDPDRIRGPLRRVGERGSGQWEPISWEEAMGEVVTRLQEIRQRGEPHTVAFMYGRTRGQMAPLIRRFMKAYGSPNTISNESLSVQAEKTANLLTQGINDLLVYDLDNTNYLLSFGASLLEAWHPTVRHLSTYGHMRRGRPIRGKIVTIDPRLSVTAAKSDEWIPIKPGTDAALALGMAHVMIQSRMYDEEFVTNYTFGFEDFEDPETGETHKGFKTLVLEEYPPSRVSEITDVPVSTIMRIAGEFAANRPKAVAAAKKGARHAGIAGIYNGMAIHCLNALVGNLDV